MNKLSNQVEQVLIGSLFGDGGLEKYSKYPIYKERHGIKQKDYLLWKKGILSQVFIIKQYFSKSGHGSIIIYSHMSPLFKNYYKHFYPYRKDYVGRKNKVFSIKMLNKLKLLGLAVWYMDDGNYNKYTITTKISFYRGAGKLVKKWFKEKLGLMGNVYLDGNGESIRFNVENSKKFIKLVSPYIHSSMIYKIKVNKEERLKAKKKHKDWVENNRDKTKRYYKKYHASNKEKRNKYNREYKKKPEVIIHRRKYQREYYQRPEVKERVKKYMKKYYKKKIENAKKS